MKEVWVLAGLTDQCSKVFEIFEDWVSVVKSVATTHPDARIDAILHSDLRGEFTLIHAITPGKLLPKTIAATYRADRRVINEVAIRL